jgi:cysteine synthase B
MGRIGECRPRAGPSSGAFVHAALRLAATGRFGTIDIRVGNTGERWLSMATWSGGIAGNG